MKIQFSKIKYALTFLSWLILWLGLGALITILGMGIAHAQPPRYFAPYDSPFGEGARINLTQSLDESGGWANATLHVDCWDQNQLREADRYNRRVICRWPWGWQLATPPPMDQVNHWASIIRPFVGNLAAISVADEPDCLISFNQWTVGRCNAASAAIDAHISVINSLFPGVPTWVNYTSAFFNWFQYPNAVGVRFPTRVTWLSLDCYTIWTACFAGVSVDRLYNAAQGYLLPHQKFVMVPPGARFFKVSGKLSLTSEQVRILARQYLNYANGNPRVVGIFPFAMFDRQTINEHWIGMRNDPIILSTYQQIGREWLNHAPTFPRPPQVTGLRIVREP